MWIEFSMSDFERIFYALSFCYIHFLLFFHFHKEITELNVNLTFSIIRAFLIFLKTNIKRKLSFFATKSYKDKMGWLIVLEIWGSIEENLSPARWHGAGAGALKCELNFLWVISKGFFTPFHSVISIFDYFFIFIKKLLN